MKKLINGVKRIFTMVGAFFTLIHSKVLATIQPILPTQEILYGIPQPHPVSIIWNITKTILIPIVFIVGTIVYLKKSTSSVKKKIIIILILLIMVVLFCFGMNAILSYLAY